MPVSELKSNVNNSLMTSAGGRQRMLRSLTHRNLSQELAQGRKSMDDNMGAPSYEDLGKAGAEGPRQ